MHQLLTSRYFVIGHSLNILGINLHTCQSFPVCDLNNIPLWPVPLSTAGCFVSFSKNGSVDNACARNRTCKFERPYKLFHLGLFSVLCFGNSYFLLICVMLLVHGSRCRWWATLEVWRRAEVGHVGSILLRE